MNRFEKIYQDMLEIYTDSITYFAEPLQKNDIKHIKKIKLLCEDIIWEVMTELNYPEKERTIKLNLTEKEAHNVIPRG